jgi:hypothetical protein
LALAFAIAKETKKNAVLGEWELPEGLTVLGRVPYIEPGSGNKPRSQRWKWALVSSVVLSILVTGAASFYLYWGRK